jgi:hypothetical protein
MSQAHTSRGSSRTAYGPTRLLFSAAAVSAGSQGWQRRGAGLVEASGWEEGGRVERKVSGFRSGM